jgi:hypothetical protein
MVDEKPILTHRHTSMSSNGGGNHHGAGTGVSEDDGETVWLDQLLNSGMLPPRQGAPDFIAISDVAEVQIPSQGLLR